MIVEIAFAVFPGKYCDNVSVTLMKLTEFILQVRGVNHLDSEGSEVTDFHVLHDFGMVAVGYAAAIATGSPTIECWDWASHLTLRKIW